MYVTRLKFYSGRSGVLFKIRTCFSKIEFVLEEYFRKSRDECQYCQKQINAHCGREITSRKKEDSSRKYLDVYSGKGGTLNVKQTKYR